MAMNGFLNINKPADWTSHDVVAHLRGRLKQTKVGHTGTLDPMATGVLPICLGQATKVAQYLLESDKAYRVVMRLGATTDTQDATGRILSRSDATVGAERILEVMNALVGPLEQIPPMYSAVKIQGQPLYKAAREGRVVDRQARTVLISRLDVLGIADGDVTFDVVCSKGTYVRTLCAEAGDRLGVGGYMQSLERRRAGRFDIAESATLAEVEDAVRCGTVARLLVAIDTVLADLPAVEVDAATADRVRHGVAAPADRVIAWTGVCRQGEPVRIRTAGETIALASPTADDADLRLGGEGRRFNIERVLSGERAAGAPDGRVKSAPGGRRSR